MLYRRLVAVAMLGVLPSLMPSLLPAQAATRSPQPLLVTIDWLAGHLRDPRVVVIHAASNRAEYDAGHVPGARFVAFNAYAISQDGLSSQMAPVAQLDSLLEGVGVNDGDHVVIYGQPLSVARLLVTMDYLGLKGSVSVLDGGVDAWREGGKTLSRESGTAARGTFTPHVDASIIVDAPWVSANSSRRGIALLDARAPEFYLGYSPGQMPRAGHIPNARNVPFSSLTGELTQLREQPKLSRLFAAAGVMPGDTVVTYCHIGMQASLLYFAARRAGFDARIYDGSFEEWSKQSDLPVVNESQKKP
ncbi:MAG: sulfurtransferase [Gemmatimonadaceae bacterium]